VKNSCFTCPQRVLEVFSLVVRNWPASNLVWSGPKVKSFLSRKVNLPGLGIRNILMRIRIHLIISMRIRSRLVHFNADTDPDSAPHHSDANQLHFADPDLAFTVLRTRFQHPKINPDPFGSGSATLVFCINVCTLYWFVQVQYRMPRFTRRSCAICIHAFSV
jgi:hypothetical protein